MALNWTTTGQEVQSGGIKVLGYAPSGVGKTVLCATAPNPIILSAEEGLLSLHRANLERIYGVGREDICYDIPVLKITCVKDLEDAYEWLTEAKEADYFQTVCLDSISEIGEQCLVHAKTLTADGRKAYGEMAEQMIDLVKKFRDLPNKNIYMSAKIEQSKDEMSGMMLYGPGMPGKKTGQQLPYLFDEVFRMGVGVDKDKKEFRYIQTQPDLQSTAKDRSGRLDQFEPMHLGHIFAKIKGN